MIRTGHLQPLDKLVLAVIVAVLVGSLLAAVVLEVRAARSRKAARLYGMGIVPVPRRVRRDRRRWTRS